MHVVKTSFHDAFILTPRVFSDDRGYFFETFHQEKFNALGFKVPFVQDNVSYSKKHVLRGMHLQWNPHQGKLVRVLHGAVYDVIVDVKKNSPTFGKWHGEELSEENHKMFWMPPGYAHGFVTLSDEAYVEYKCTGVWNGKCEISLLWNDPKIGVEWPVASPLLSPKDKEAQTLETWLKTPEFQVFNDTLPVNPVLHEM